MARTLTVSLGPHYENFMQSTITSGRHDDASEVVRAALRPLEDDEAGLAALRSAIDEGDSSPDVEDFNRNVFLAELKAKRNRHTPSAKASGILRWLTPWM